MVGDTMELDALLRQFDIASANLARLDQVWERASSLIPDSIQFGSDPEYDELSRQWADLVAALAPIDGWQVSGTLLDLNELGQWRFDVMEAGNEPSDLIAIQDGIEGPGRELAEYRYHLRRARRGAVGRAAEELMTEIDQMLPLIIAEHERDRQPISDPRWLRLGEAFRELDRLVGDAVSRRGRWEQLRRHLAWSQGQDAHDIAIADWPSVKLDVEAAVYPDVDPLPGAEADLGVAAREHLSGGVLVQLAWEVLTDERFERLLFDILRTAPDYENVQWLTRTNAPDRGRDLSADKISRDSTGLMRKERVIIQAKHWLTKSVSATDVNDIVGQCQLWEPPAVHFLVIATSGRFTSDAVDWIEKHNLAAKRPFVDLWPENRLESLLAANPHIAVAHGLR